MIGENKNKHSKNIYIYFLATAKKTKNLLKDNIYQNFMEVFLERIKNKNFW